MHGRLASLVIRKVARQLHIGITTSQEDSVLQAMCSTVPVTSPIEDVCRYSQLEVVAVVSVVQSSTMDRSEVLVVNTVRSN